ncbi:MAG: FAD:protein FMN transferase [Clostridia bacterium]|nr:FAD:protein FMN transferase [Clostridia bacterium]
MKYRLRFLCVLCVLCLLCGGCQAEKAPQKFSASFYDAFDTVIIVTGYADSQETFDAVYNQAKDMFLHYHRIYDGYKAYEGVHNLYYVNKNAANGPVPAEPELIDLLLYMKDMQPRLLGRVNVAMGAVLSYWHECREAGEALPEERLLRAYGNHVNFDDVIIDESAGTIYFADPYLSLDLGAVAKGYATEIVASWLLTSGMTSYIISAGGNVRCGERPLDGRARWGVGIQDPEDALFSNSIKDVVYLTDMSVVTSGDYQRYYVVDGVRYHHIIDPDTLFPSAYMRQVTVVTRDSGYADALSTMLFLLPYEEGRAFVDSQPDVEAYWVLNDGTVEFTDGLTPILRSQGGSAIN